MRDTAGRMKVVIIGKAFRRVLKFAAGFRPGSRFAYFVYIASCTTHFAKRLRNNSFHQRPKREKSQESPSQRNRN